MYKVSINQKIQKKLDKFRKAFPNADDFNYKNLDNKHDQILKRLKLEGGLNSINLSNLRNWSMQSDMGISRISRMKLPAIFAKINNILGFLYASIFEKFFRKSFYDSLRDLRKADNALTEKVNKIEVVVAGQYVTREDFDGTINILFAKLDKISDKLDNKADK